MIEKEAQLQKLVFYGASQKNLEITDKVLDRISFELTVIDQQGFTDYFIIYSRVIEICNELNLIRSFGRGSAPNSIVNYCLDITKINPIKENLIFERFILPEQKQLPDIDIDIPKGYHKEVIDKLKQKFPEYYGYNIAFLPQITANYKDVIFENKTYKKHPCGIIITKDPVRNPIFTFQDFQYCLVHDHKNDPIFDSKFDILELEYFNRLQLIVDEIGKEYHPNLLALNDEKVFDFLASGDLENIFQFDSSSCQRILSQFQPKSIYELTMINAMFRPGPLKYIPNLIYNKFHSAERLYPAESIFSKFLDETFGLLIYQETFLHISKEIAGISYAETETWRRKIIRDKSNSELNEFCSLFFDRCKQHNILKEAEIVILVNLIKEMLPICFQKSHSLCYSRIGYWGAYYKTHFRDHFDKAFSEDVIFEKD